MTVAEARQGSGMAGSERRVLAATLVGTTIEWYDFFIYAQAAALVFGALFFGPLTRNDPFAAQIIAFATIGISFLFRPLGAIVCGHLGDRFGRRSVLVFTLVLMGAATALIGLLPTYAQIGVWAPILLVLLRIVQGFSAGGEWGGAALMAVEYAPADRRSVFGSFPQVGVPLGMILATGVLLGLTLLLGQEAMTQWGWRVPFLFSILLIVIGAVIRFSIEETPVFRALQQRRRESAAPLNELFAGHSGRILRTALTFIANNAAGYILIAFMISYGGKVAKPPQAQLLAVATLSAFTWLLFTLLGGWLGDRIGRIRTFQIGYALLFLWAVPMWFLIDSQSIGLFAVAAIGLSVPLGLTYGPQAALFAELFPAKIRYSGISVAYALGAILGGAFAPTIAEWLLARTGQSWSVGVYLAVLSVISFLAITAIEDPQGVDLNG